MLALAVAVVITLIVRPAATTARAAKDGLARQTNGAELMGATFLYGAGDVRVVVNLDQTPEGYRAMDDRTALKVLVRP